MSAIIRSVLSPVLKLWLRSQVEMVQDLEISIDGADGQILKGNIPQAQVSGQGIIYQGLYLTKLNLVATDIHLNIPQILKGQTLKLLDPLAVKMVVSIDASDFQLCLKSPLVLEALGSELPPFSSDREIRFLLGMLLKLLGDQFILDELKVTDGNCYCLGVFKIAPT